MEWEEEAGKIVVRRAGKYSFEDIHRALFSNKKPKPHTLEELKEAIPKYIREKYGRRLTRTFSFA